MSYAWGAKRGEGGWREMIKSRRRTKIELPWKISPLCAFNINGRDARSLKQELFVRARLRPRPSFSWKGCFAKILIHHEFYIVNFNASHEEQDSRVKRMEQESARDWWSARKRRTRLKSISPFISFFVFFASSPSSAPFVLYKFHLVFVSSLRIQSR